MGSRDHGIMNGTVESTCKGNEYWSATVNGTIVQSFFCLKTCPMATFDGIEATGNH